MPKRSLRPAQKSWAFQHGLFAGPTASPLLQELRDRGHCRFGRVPSVLESLPVPRRCRELGVAEEGAGIRVSQGGAGAIMPISGAADISAAHEGGYGRPCQVSSGCCPSPSPPCHRARGMLQDLLHSSGGVSSGTRRHC